MSINRHTPTILSDAGGIDDDDYAAAVDEEIKGLWNRSLGYLSSVSGTNTLTATCAPALDDYMQGMRFAFIPANINTGPATLNIDGRGARTIKDIDGANLIGGELLPGRVAIVIDDGSNLRLVNNFKALPQKRQLVRVATTGNINIATGLNAGDVQDGVTLANGDVGFVGSQDDAAENGVYVVGVSPARAAAFDTWDEHVGALIVVAEGTTNAGRVYQNTNNPGGVLGTDPIIFGRVNAVDAASESAPGIVELADATETVAGTDTTRATHPAGVKAALDAAVAALVAGPGSATDNDFAQFDGATGKLIKGGVEAASTTEALTGTATNRLVTPDALAALWEKGADVASASTIILGEGGYFHITGTTAITDIDFAVAKDGRAALLVFDGALTLTHHATTLILPGGANIVTAAGDACLVVQDAGDNVKVAAYFRANGRPVDAVLAAIAALATTAGNFIVGNGSTFAVQSGDTARTSLGLGTGDSPKLTGLTVGPSGAASVSRLTVVDEGISPPRGCTVAMHADSIAGALFSYRRSRGSRASPTAVASGDYGGFFSFAHHDGTAYLTNSYIGTRITGSVSTNGIPHEIFFSTRINGDSDPYTDGTVRFAVRSNGELVHGNAVTFVGAAGHLRMRSYTVSTLPSAATVGEWIYVSNESGGATPAFSDGANWRRVADRAIVS